VIAASSSPAAAFEACSMAALIEARRDGRLGEREGASLARHVGTCAACRAHERALDEVRALLRQPAAPAPTPLEHQRGRLALLRAAAAPPSSSASSRGSRSSRALATALAVGAAAVVTLGAAGVRSTRHASVPVALRMPSPAGLLARQDDARVRTETVVRGSDGSRFERRTEGEVERVTLAEGTLDLSVRKLGNGERFLVATDDAEVEVRGTVFAVEAHGGHVARVEVEEGKVEVRYRGSVSIIAAGGAWRAPRGDGGATASPVAVAIAASPVVSTTDDVARGASRGAGATSPRAAVHLAAFEPGDDRAHAAHHADPHADDASKAFGAAVDMLGRGDYAAARSQLDAFQAAHPHDARADLAAFLTIVSLQRAGRTVEAKEAARRYLTLYPSGDRRAEAERVANAH
jgi:hypothetical protein